MPDRLLDITDRKVRFIDCLLKMQQIAIAASGVVEPGGDEAVVERRG